MSSIGLDDIDDDQPSDKPDFRRANGAPMVLDKDGKNQRLSRPSGWGKILDDENALVNWKIDRAAKGVAGDSALQAAWVAVKDGSEGREERGKLREKAIEAGRGAEAADTGTALHAMSERWEDPDDDFDPPDKYRKSLEAYSAELARLGLVSELMEYKAVNMEYRAAGTCDRLYRLTRDLVTPKGEVLPAGTLVVGDLKTGKKLDFSLPGYCVQMAIYAQGEFYDVETEQFRPTPEIDQNWGILVHMPIEGDYAGQCRMLWADLEIGNWGAYLVHEVRDWRRKWKNGTYECPEVASPSAEAATDPGGSTPPSAQPDSEHRTWREVAAEQHEKRDPITYIKTRVAKIRDYPKAAEQLRYDWPKGVPGPGKLEEEEHIEQVMDVLDKIERDHGVSF